VRLTRGDVRDDPHTKRSQTFVLVLQRLTAVERTKNRLSRDFRSLSIFDFFNSIGQKRRFGDVRVTSALPGTR
jgi:hypothetical protein